MERAYPDKNSDITAVIHRLGRRLGTEAFEIVDHWEGDMAAVGIGSPADKRILVYISTYGCEKGCYDFELERPPSERDTGPYTVAGGENAASFEILLAAVIRHLGIEQHR